MKRGPMSNSDKDFLIKNKNRTLKFLSKKLNRTEESIQVFLESINPKIEEVIKEPKPETPISASLARNKKYGAVIMTPTASMISDEKRKKPTGSKRSSNYIFIINPEQQ